MTFDPLLVRQLLDSFSFEFRKSGTTGRRVVVALRHRTFMHSRGQCIAFPSRVSINHLNFWSGTSLPRSDHVMQVRKTQRGCEWLKGIAQG